MKKFGHIMTRVHPTVSPSHLFVHALVGHESGRKCFQVAIKEYDMNIVHSCLIDNFVAFVACGSSS